MSPRITKILLLSVLLGILSGLGGILFHALLELVSHLFLHNLAGYDPPRPAHEFAFLKPAGGIERRWLLALLPAAGGLLCGALVYWLAPEAAGHGSDAAIEAYHFHDGKIRYRVPFVKLFSAALTIGSGGSGGAEGPITQIGAGIGSWLADKAKLSPNDRRTFMAAGMASGIAAIFRAPLAGALFSAEVLYKDLDIEHEVLVPAFISSTVAYSVFGAFAGWEPLFETPHFVFDNPGRLIPYAVLACVESAAAIGFIKLFYALHDLFARLGIPPFLKPALGGLCCGIIGYFIPDALGTGYGVIQEALGGKLPIIALLIIAGAKMFTTSFSIGSGGSGGVFGPSVVIGGALGGVVGEISHQLLPGLHVNPGAFVIVGMAGFFAAAANCPISTILLVSEVTGNFRLLVPAMFVCMIAYLLGRNFTLYRAQLGSRLEAPSKMGGMLDAVLRKLTVADALRVSPPRKTVSLDERMPIREICALYTQSDQECFPVFNASHALRGIIDAKDIRRLADEKNELEGLVLACDFMKPAVVLGPSDTLLMAVHRMEEADREEILVRSDEASHAVFERLSRQDITRACQHLAQHKFG